MKRKGGSRGGEEVCPLSLLQRLLGGGGGGGGV